jgi:signal transduction histidine kinase
MDRTDRLRWIATWLALATALGLGLWFVLIRATTPSDGARVDFYGEAWSARGITIAPIDPPAAGLVAGDTVTAVAGRPLEAWLGAAAAPWAPGPAAPDPESAIDYRLVRAGADVEAAVRWAVPPIGGTLLEGWAVIVFSLAVAAVAGFVFALRPAEPAARALMIAACAAAGSSVPWFLGVTVSDVVAGGPFLLYTLITGPLYILLWPAGVHFALTFPAPARALGPRPWLIPAVYAATLLAYALLLVLSRVLSPTALDWVGTWPLIQVGLVVPMLSVAIGLFVRRYRRDTDLARRARTRWAVAGGLASGILGLGCFMVPELIARRTLLPPSWIGLIALPLPVGIAVGIVRDRLFEIDVVIRRTLVYGGLSVGVIACYLAAVSVIGAALGGSSGYGASLLATGVAALVALPLRDGLQRGVNRLLYGERDEPVRAIRRLGERLELATDPDLAYPAIVDTVADALRLPFVALDVIDAAGRPVLAAERGHPGPTVVSIDLGHGSEHVGVLRLATRTGERAFRPDESRLLGDLARQAGAAVHALRLREDLARSRERLVLAREEERRRLRRDLHDGLGPSLASIGLRAGAAGATLSSDPVAAGRLLDELGAEVEATLADVRRLVDGLRPPALDELGLVGAIRAQAARLEGGGTEPGTAISVEATPADFPDVPAAVEVAAYRIVAEAMTNAVRHAAARTCRIRLDAGSDLRVEVIDDGHGLPRRVVRGTGLDSMSARAAELGGTLRVERRPGGGTVVDARLPLAGSPVAMPLAPDAARPPEAAPGTVPS